MSAHECTIFRFFRRYQTGPAQMLFFNSGDCKLSAGVFQSTMHSLINQGLVVKERPKQAYSLTTRGYGMSLSVETEPVSKR